MPKRPVDWASEINGKLYFTVKRFAWVTRKSEQNIRFLMSYGNRIRKLRVAYIGEKPYVPYEEFLEFPFTLPGRNSRTVYHYTEDGQVKEDELERGERSGVQHDGEPGAVSG